MTNKATLDFDAGFLHSLGISETEPFPQQPDADDSLIHELENELTKAGQRLDRSNRRAEKWKSRAQFRGDVVAIGSMLFGIVCFLVWVTRP